MPIPRYLERGHFDNYAARFPYPDNYRFVCDYLNDNYDDLTITTVVSRILDLHRKAVEEGTMVIDLQELRLIRDGLSRFWKQLVPYFKQEHNIIFSSEHDSLFLAAILPVEHFESNKLFAPRVIVPNLSICPSIETKKRRAAP